MVKLRNFVKGVASYAGAIGVVGVLTAATIEHYTTASVPFDRPKNVYEAKLQNDKSSDLVVRLESGTNEIMLRGNDGGLTGLKDKKQEELNRLKADYNIKTQKKISEYSSLKQRLTAPEETNE